MPESLLSWDVLTMMFQVIQFFKDGMGLFLY